MTSTWKKEIDLKHKLPQDPPVGRDPVFSVVAIRDLRKLPGWFCLIQNKRAPMTDLQRESSMDIEVAVTELGKTRVVPWEGVRIFGRVEKGDTYLSQT